MSSSLNDNRKQQRAVVTIPTEQDRIETLQSPKSRLLNAGNRNARFEGDDLAHVATEGAHHEKEHAEDDDKKKSVQLKQAAEQPSRQTLIYKDMIQRIVDRNDNEEDPEIETLRIDQQNLAGMEDGRVTKFYFERLMNFEYTLLFFAMTGLGFTIIYYDNDFKTFDQSTPYDNENATNVTLWVIFCISIFQIVITYLRYISQLDLLFKQHQVTRRDTLRSTGLLRTMLIEIFIILLQPYPFSNDVYFISSNYYDHVFFKFKLNWLLSLLSLLRVFVILRVILKKTQFLTPRAQRLCRMYGCESDYLYVIKCLFQDYPMTLIIVVFVISIITFAFALRMTERPLKFIGLNNMDFEVFENAVWCVWITMTTVGYGDFFPRTQIGRIINIAIAIWGIFVVSMMVVVLNNMLNMDSAEKRALTVLNRLDLRNDLKDKAAMLLTSVAVQKIIETKLKNESSPQLREFLREQKAKVKHASEEFRSVSRKIKNMYDKDDVYEEMARQFDFVRDEIKQINENQEKLCRYLEENFSLGMIQQQQQPQKRSEA